MEDGRLGKQSVCLRRQLRDRFCEVHRSRDLSTGEETTRRVLHNVDNDVRACFF